MEEGSAGQGQRPPWSRPPGLCVRGSWRLQCPQPGVRAFLLCPRLTPASWAWLRFRELTCVFR